MSGPTNDRECDFQFRRVIDPEDESDFHYRNAMNEPMHEFALHEDELLHALEELAEIVEIICAPIIPPALATPATEHRR